jgi:hypothetical protein
MRHDSGSRRMAINGTKSEMVGEGEQAGVGGWDEPSRGKEVWENNASRCVRVGYGAGSRGRATENTKKAKWGVGG